MTNEKGIRDKVGTNTLCGGQSLKRALFAARQWLERHAAAVNALNVFPVPDGDTGTNMLLTMNAALAEIERTPDNSVSVIVHAVAHGPAARGWAPAQRLAGGAAERGRMGEGRARRQRDPKHAAHGDSRGSARGPGPRGSAAQRPAETRVSLGQEQQKRRGRPEPRQLRRYAGGVHQRGRLLPRRREPVRL